MLKKTQQERKNKFNSKKYKIVTHNYPIGLYIAVYEKDTNVPIQHILKFHSDKQK